MKQEVLLTIRGQQQYGSDEPDVIELVTDGTLEQCEDGWDLSYEESDLTGLQGVRTTFRVRENTVVLDRTGALRSQMVFQEGVSHESLYQMEFGALLISVCATRIHWEITQEGGFLDVAYRIAVEESAAGEILYHITIQPAKH